MKYIDSLVQEIFNALTPTKTKITLAVILALLSMFLMPIGMLFAGYGFKDINAIYSKYIALTLIALLKFFGAGILFAQYLSINLMPPIEGNPTKLYSVLRLITFLSFQAVWLYFLTAPLLYLKNRKKIKNRAIDK